MLWPPRSVDGRLRVTVLDVGQADAIVVQTPRGHAILVDAGGRLERGPQSNDSTAERIGERIVVPFLLRHGIHALDAVIDLASARRSCRRSRPGIATATCRELADGGKRYGGHAYRTASTARAEACRSSILAPATEWHTDDGVTLHFLGPSLPFIANSRNDINENSIAFIFVTNRSACSSPATPAPRPRQRFLREGTDLRCDVRLWFQNLENLAQKVGVLSQTARF